MSENREKEIFADNLNYYMSLRGKEQVDIINDLGINKSTISTWCNGKKMPRMGMIQTLSQYLGLRKSDLIEERIPANAIPYIKGRRLPIVGSIPAGLPVLAEQNIEGYDYADVPEGEVYFFLRVSGDSMINASIFNNDLVLIKQQPCAENGQIVACIVNGDEATLKRFNRQGDTVVLQPENPTYFPIIISCKEFENGYARIIGVAKEVKHRL